MFLASDGQPLCVGDEVRAPVSINQNVHGTWAEYEIKKAPGGYVLSYLRSEKGQVLPIGYTAGYMYETIPDDDEVDHKTLVFTQVPIQIDSWVRRPKS